MAFGTGTHETTSMCIRELENYVDETKTVFDIAPAYLCAADGAELRKHLL